jgi:hypothetical protein
MLKAGLMDKYRCTMVETTHLNARYIGFSEISCLLLLLCPLCWLSIVYPLKCVESHTTSVKTWY